MINRSGSIHCPSCGCEIDMEDAISQHMQAHFESEMAAHRDHLEDKYAQKESLLIEREKELEVAGREEAQLLQEDYSKKMRDVKSHMKLQFRTDLDSAMRDKNMELKEVEEQVIQLRAQEIENARLKRKLSHQQQELELEFENKLTQRTEQLEKEIAVREETRQEMRIIEKEKQLTDQKKLIDQLRQKAEQGSQQMQGEVQEMAIESWLVAQFPIDTIEEIRQGVRGGDILQIVNTRTKVNCGVIYYESKRTKDFQSGWIDKFKTDMRDKSAYIGVIVTRTMPKDMPRMGMRKGVWICSFSEFKSLCFVLREMVIKVKDAIDRNENKGEKMEQLYDYLTGNEFRMYMEAVVEGFTQMREDLHREKNAMTRLWKQREKQIQKVLENTSSLFGAMKGIAGASLPDIDVLKLPGE